MDIHDWLRNIGSQASLDAPPPFSVDPALRHPTRTAPSNTRQDKKRRRSSSKQLVDDEGRMRNRSRDRNHPNQITSSSEHEHSHSSNKRKASKVKRSSSSCGERRTLCPPLNSYERRPRHKTRADRYILKSDAQRKTDTKKAREKRFKADPKRAYRAGDGSRTAGFVKNFKLRQGPTKARLTLQPEMNAGIFSHGRASSQVPCTGRGLPDLAFNEMKFLQKPQEHREQPKEASTGQKTSERRRQEKVSSFFQPDATIPGRVRDTSNGMPQESSQTPKALQKSLQILSGRRNNETGGTDEDDASAQTPLRTVQQYPKTQQKFASGSSLSKLPWSESLEDSKLKCNMGASVLAQQRHWRSRQKDPPDNRCSGEHGRDSSNPALHWQQSMYTSEQSVVLTDDHDQDRLTYHTSDILHVRDTATCLHRPETLMIHDHTSRPLAETHHDVGIRKRYSELEQELQGHKVSPALFTGHENVPVPLSSQRLGCRWTFADDHALRGQYCEPSPYMSAPTLPQERNSRTVPHLPPRSERSPERVQPTPSQSHTQDNEQLLLRLEENEVESTWRPVFINEFDVQLAAFGEDLRHQPEFVGTNPGKNTLYCQSKQPEYLSKLTRTYDVGEQVVNVPDSSGAGPSAAKDEMAQYVIHSDYEAGTTTESHLPTRLNDEGFEDPSDFWRPHKLY